VRRPGWRSRPAKTHDLGTIRQPGGKVVHAFAVEGDADAASVTSNTFTLEWPRGSGRTREFPEVDRAGWFALADARGKLLRGQLPLLERLQELVGDG
jgi:predicted NUDIX family NTP pyrophosphohydrolase